MQVFEKIEDYRDMPTLNEYQHQKNIGGDLKKYMEYIKFSCRDNGRTGMQWDSSSNAGFTTGTPWLATNRNYKEINVAAQETDENSCLNYFRKMVKLRKDNNVLVYGKFTLIDKNNPDVFAFTRELNEKKILVMLNFRSKPVAVNTLIDVRKAKLLISNYKSAAVNGALQPYEAVIYEL